MEQSLITSVSSQCFTVTDLDCVYLLEPGQLVCMYEEDLLIPSPELVNVTKVV